MKQYSDRGQRPVRVGEEIRRLLDEAIRREGVYLAGIGEVSISITEVSMSPDLKNAKIFIMPLAREHREKILVALQDRAGFLRSLVAKKLRIRHIPRLHFHIDESFDEADRIEKLLKSPSVARDLGKNDDSNE
jgi:ribosome-binding factor A